MTKKELYKMDFEEAVEELREENDCITTYDALLDFAKWEIEEQNIWFALHILTAIYNSENSYYYNYDYSIGTLDKPTPISSLEDLEDFCDD